MSSGYCGVGWKGGWGSCCADAGGGGICPPTLQWGRGGDVRRSIVRSFGAAPCDLFFPVVHLRLSQNRTKTTTKFMIRSTEHVKILYIYYGVRCTQLDTIFKEIQVLEYYKKCLMNLNASLLFVKTIWCQQGNCRAKKWFEYVINF